MYIIYYDDSIIYKGKSFQIKNKTSNEFLNFNLVP